MPRKKPRGDEQTLEAPMLMLPAPRLPKHGHDRETDPYKTLVGAVPGHMANERVIQQKPIERVLSEAEQAQQLLLRNEQVALGHRYDTWIDALILAGGDKPKAFVSVGMARDEAEALAHLYELEVEVRRGMSASDVGKAYERNYLGVAEQAKVLSRWVYSDNAAASINALKLAQEQSGASESQGSFEQFLRLSKMSQPLK